jgi:Cu/Ag efflux protein CusF
MSNQRNRTCRVFFIALVCGGVFLFSSCHKAKTPITKRYAFTGRVVSIDGQAQSAVIDGDAVPGFMAAMAMTYKIKPATELSQLAPGDSISAEVVVVESDDKNEGASDYWLENVKVTAHGKSPPPTAALHIARDEP